MSANADDLPETLLVLIVCGLILAVGVFAASTLVESSGEYEQQTHVLLDGTSWTDVDGGDKVGTDETVYDSRGYAIELTGATDSYFESKQSVELASDDTWTASVWAAADADAAADEMVAVSLDGRLIVVYDEPDAQWRAWFYDEGSRDSYLVNVSAPNQPANLSNVQVTRNATALAIYRNTTRGEVADLTQSNVAPSPDATNWDGRVDELRLHDDDVSAATRGELYSSPIDPQPDTNRTLRAMFDEPYSSTQLLLFTGTALRTSNATYSTGLPGQELSDGGLFSAGDYDWRDNGPQIRPVSGGEIENAPVAYVDYSARSAGELDSFVPQFTNMVSFAGLALVVMVLATIVTYLQAARGRR